MIARVRRLTLLALPLALLSCDASPTTDAGVDAGAPTDAGVDGDVDAGLDAGPLCEPAIGLPDPLVCNGHEALCDRPYDQVAFPAAHNAMSSEEEGWIPPNQGYRLWRQLEDGVRGFLLDTYEKDGETLLCHSICPLGSRPFVDALIDLRTFMECHPAEVIALVLESYIDEARTEAAFEAAGLMPMLHAQTLGEPWPTLRAMIESGRRMVVFTQSADVTLPWHHYAWDHGFDNDYANTTPSDLNCDVNRGRGDNAIFMLNHFLTAPVAMRSLAEMVNFDPFFLAQAQRCQAERGHIPNLVTVDFYEVGDLLTVVDALNGF